MKYKSLKKIFLFLFLFAVVSCHNAEIKEKVKAKENLLKIIKKRGTLIATTNTNSVDYFIYKGYPMGFQLELLNAFAHYLGVKLEIIVANDIASTAGLLAVGKCDLIAENITINEHRRRIVNFTIPIFQTREVLIQRNPEKTKDEKLKNTFVIKNLSDLAGKTVYVQKNSIHFDQLQKVQEEIKQKINIIESDTNETEQLIEQVANGIIDYAVSDENFAQVNTTYFNNLDINLPIDGKQSLGWAVRQESEDFLVILNNWLSEFLTTAAYKKIYDTYYRNSRTIGIVHNELYTIKRHKISKFDAAIKKHSHMIGWDWRLLASLIYQESNFQPNLVGWSGAFGVMQMMPGTAYKFGITEKSSVADQIKGGVRLIRLLDKLLPKEITKPDERIKFTLAAYNAGFDHIMDARNLCKKYGQNPNIWTNNVEVYIRLMSKPKFYNDTAVKFGYSRGYETYRFVNEVLDRYYHYKNMVKK
ncbi:MAG: transporter substrate-binding domain-containing protein [Bacteroidetes bacterium]|nr:transporter substrate-binding domain-containing protein [Bacteroidota bacterium]